MAFHGRERKRLKWEDIMVQKNWGTQKKAIDYALDKLIPMIQNVGSQALSQFSAKIRPNKKYKTSLQDKIAYFAVHL